MTIRQFSNGEWFIYEDADEEVILGSGATLLDALIGAELHARRVLDAVQGSLHAEHARLKAEAK